MTDDSSVEALRRAADDEPNNLAHKLKLAAALREAGEPTEAVSIYRDVAVAYRDQGRFAQATAVCQSALEIDGDHAELRRILADVELSPDTRTFVGGAPADSDADFGTDTASRPPGVPGRAGGAVKGPRRKTLRGLRPAGAKFPIAPPRLAERSADVKRWHSGEVVPVSSPLSTTVGVTPAAAGKPSAEPDQLDDMQTVPVTALPNPVPTDSVDLAAAFDRPFHEQAAMMAEERREFDRALALFPGMPDEAVDDLVRGVVRRRFAAGEVILREGEPGEAFFIITSGRVRVLKRDPVRPRGDLLSVSELSSGDLFGEFALLADKRRHATVQAVEPVEAFEVSRHLVRDLTDAYPELEPILLCYYRERLIGNLLATAPFLSLLPESSREQLIPMFVSMRADSGEVIIEPGARAGGFFLIVLGSVEITKTVDDAPVLLASLGEGAYFGELSLMRGDVARATVTASGATELAMLPPDAFFDLIAKNPVLWESLRREAHRRELSNYEIVAGVTGMV